MTLWPPRRPIVVNAPHTHTALEFVTRGLARATSHRVLSPSIGSTARYSVPFFQNISLNARLADEVLDCTSPPALSPIQ